MKFSKTKLLDNVLMLFFIICSGSFIGIRFTYSKYLDILFLLTGFIAFLSMSEKYLDKKNTLKYALFICLYLASYFLNISYSPNRNAYFAYMIRMTATLFFCSYITKDRFEKYFVKWIELLSIIGLVVFIYAILSGNHGSEYMLGPFNMIKINECRNSNIFWEPGAYQLFLNYSILILLYNSQWGLSNINKRTLLILVISLLSTKSTTGYIVFAIIIIGYISHNWSKMSIKNRLYSFIPLAVVLILTIWILFQTDTVINKFSSNNASFIIRTNDLFNTFNVILRNRPIFGYGYESRLVTTRGSELYILENSVGIWSQTMTVGIIFTLLFTFQMIKRAYFRYSRDIAMVIILLITCFTEDFYFYPIYFVWLFSFKEESKYCDVKQNV